MHGGRHFEFLRPRSGGSHLLKEVSRSLKPGEWSEQIFSFLARG